MTLSVSCSVNLVQTSQDIWMGSHEACTNIQGLKMMNPTDFGLDALTC